MEESKTALAVIETASPAAQIEHAGQVAAACRAIVAATAQTIQGRRYVKVEGWQAIALAHGCVASSGDVMRLETGFSAVGEVRRSDTGVVVARAEGFVGDDEATWSKRAEYARRAMAQTRAISRACRSAFAHVVVMMNAGLETTPFEEMDGIHPSAPVPEETARREAPVAANNRTISEAQVKRLFAKMRAGNHAPAETRAWLQRVFGVTESSQILRSNYEGICARLEDPTPLGAAAQSPAAPAGEDDFLPEFEAGAEG